MHGAADDAVLHVQVAADSGDDDFAGIQPHSDRYRHAVQALNVIGVTGDRLLHPKRRVACTHGVILMSKRRAEQGENSIAHDLIDGTLIAVDRFDHPFEHAMKQLPGVLGVAVSDQFHRPLHIGEQHRDVLSFASKGRSRCENLIREVPGREDFRRSEAWIASGTYQGLPALRAEFRGR